VCDLDASRRDDKEVKSGSKGTGPYRAPEIKLHESEYTIKIDNFSFGVLMLECLERKFPESRPEASTVSEQFKESVFGKQMDDKYKFKDLKDMIVKLLSEQPENRPDFEAIKDSLLDMRGENLTAIMHALRMSEEQKNTGEANVTGLELGTQQTSSPCVISANKTD
jgi:serine/threonine protein kinase